MTKRRGFTKKDENRRKYSIFVNRVSPFFDIENFTKKGVKKKVFARKMRYRNFYIGFENAVGAIELEIRVIHNFGKFFLPY